MPRQSGRRSPGGRGNRGGPGPGSGGGRIVRTIVAEPDADVETTTVDGLARRNVNEGYAALRVGAGTGNNDDSTLFQATLSSINDGRWSGITRGIMLFDLAGILPGSREVLSATLSYVVHLATDSHAPQFVSLVQAAPASDVAIVSADYAIANFSMDDLLAPALALEGMVVGTRAEYTFNAAGIAYLQTVFDGDQIARVGAVLESDRTGVEPTHPLLSVTTTHSIRSAEYSATIEAGNSPLLTVRYH